MKIPYPRFRFPHKLRDFEIKEYYAELGAIEPLLDNFANLRRLSIGWSFCTELPMAVGWCQLGDMLRTSSLLLEELRITVPAGTLGMSLTGIDPDQVPIAYHGLRSPQDLGHLSTMIVPDFVLFGYQALYGLVAQPPTLNELLSPSVQHLEVHCDVDTLGSERESIFGSPGADAIAELVIHNRDMTERLTKRDMDKPAQ